MSRIHWYGPTLMLLCTTLVIMIIGPSVVRQIETNRRDTRIELTRDQLLHNPTLAELSDAFRQVSRIVEPSVVFIEVRSRQRGVPGDARRFFDPDVRRESSGSGWVYDREGHIVTNHHVIEAGDNITVRFQDGAEYQARIVGTDPRTDVAVLRVDARHLQPARIAPNPVEQGDIVFAFGSPFRFDFSMSQGVVSAKGRQLGILRSRGGYENFIQTDAAINVGNSGGPLTNIYGEVVGMNTAIASPGDVFGGRSGFVGLGFAIPVKMVEDVARQLISAGTVRRGYIGVIINDLDPRLARSFGFEGKGALVDDLAAGGPAADAGLMPGDIITHVDDQPIDSADALRLMVSQLPPGTVVSLRIFRDGDTQTLEVTLGELPEQTMIQRQPFVPVPPQAEDPQVERLRQIGLEELVTMTQPLARRIDLGYTAGVLIQVVRPGSIAQEEGMGRGMIISHVNDQPVTTVDELVQALNRYEDGDLVRFNVQIWSDAEQRYYQRFIAVELP